MCTRVYVLGTRRHEIIERSLLVSAGTRVAAVGPIVFSPFVSVFFRPTRDLAYTGREVGGPEKKTKNTTTTARVTIVTDTRLIISDFHRHTALNGPTRAFCMEFRVIFRRNRVEATARPTQRTWTFADDAHRPKSSKNHTQTAVTTPKF